MAIAIALMPPLAVVGFGIATANWTVFSGALLLFLTNAVTIALTAAIVARLYGFGSHLSHQHTGWQLALFVGALGVLSIPLVAALRQIAFEAVAQRQTRDTICARFPDTSRLGQLDIDYGAKPIRIRAVVFTPRLEPGRTGYWPPICAPGSAAPSTCMSTSCASRWTTMASRRPSSPAPALRPPPAPPIGSSAPPPIWR